MIIIIGYLFTWTITKNNRLNKLLNSLISLLPKNHLLVTDFLQMEAWHNQFMTGFYFLFNYLKNPLPYLFIVLQTYFSYKKGFKKNPYKLPSTT
jgi:hypothetical protein